MGYIFYDIRCSPGGDGLILLKANRLKQTKNKLDLVAGLVGLLFVWQAQGLRQLCRADAGLEEYPTIPFGTRVMVVKDPPPRSAFMPRAEPATIFGPCEFVSGASWTYQHGLVKARTNIQPQGMSDDDIAWVKTNMSGWDAPDVPLPLPSVLSLVPE